jgi:hypothetical protein
MEELWKVWFSGLARRQDDVTIRIRGGKVPGEGQSRLRREAAFDGELLTREVRKMANRDEANQESTVEELWKTWYSGLQKKHNDFTVRIKGAVGRQPDSARQKSVVETGLASREAGNG